MKIKSLLSIFVLASALLLFSFTPFYSQQASTEPFVVVLDAGHGGHDPGNLGNGYLEKNIALNIVLKVGEILGKNKDIKVIYTRKDDTFIDLFVRGEIANKANADLFVSVHCDSHTSDAHGAGTFVLGLHANKQNFEIAKKENSVIYLEDNYETRYADYDINAPESVIGLTIMQEEFLDQSIALAKMIQDNFSGKLKRTNRKVKQAGFIVLHQTFMPSVLVETGFLTNKNEGAYLDSKKGQVEMGTAIADAILKYQNATQMKVKQSDSNFGNTKELEVEEQKDIEEIKKEKIVVEEPAMEVKVVQAREPIVEEKQVVEVVKEKYQSIPKEVDLKNSEEVKPLEIDKTGDELDSKEKVSNVIFKVQLMASGKELPLVPENFKGLNLISKESYKTLFRYMYGNTQSHREAQMMKTKAVDKGYKTAYIVAYKEGVRISLTEALRLVSQ
jgi:N-acetylmuramoyl-L-alanine amidase